MKIAWEILQKQLLPKEQAYLLKIDNIKRAVLIWDGDFVERPDSYYCVMSGGFSMNCSPNLDEAKKQVEDYFKNE